MRAVAAAILFFASSIGFAEGTPAMCGSQAKIKAAIADLSNEYGDVRLPLQCKKPSNKSEALICSDGHLLLMYRLNAMSDVYAIENATKQPVDHASYKGHWVPKCTTKACMCKAFSEAANDNLGGQSPYYVEQ